MKKIIKNINDVSNYLGSEAEQSIMRFIIAAGTLIYLLLWVHPQNLTGANYALYTVITYTIISLLIYISVRLSPTPTNIRLIFSILIDVATLSIFMAIGGEWVLGMSWIYLIIIIGNGFRFGSLYLKISFILSLMGFTTACIFNNYWISHPINITGVYLSILVLTFYVNMLLTRLTDAVATANESVKAKSLFLANMSHEIRTPMNGILGMLELSLNEPLPKPLYKRLKIAQSSADALLVLINDILDLSKIEAGKITFENIDFDAKELLDDIISLLQQRAIDKKISLSGNFTSDIGRHVRGDPTRIRQSIINLVGNALKFTQKGGVGVYISLKKQDDTVLFQCKVCDSGIGIPEHALEHIFDTFTQADASTTRNFGGTGLGLALTKRLITEMGGKISVNSKLGKGSIFSFDIPLEIGTQHATPTSSESLHLKQTITQENSQTNKTTTTEAIIDIDSKVKILLAEDNPVNQIVIKQMLDSLDCDVTIASNGQLLVDIIEKNPDHGFALIFMDCQMPVMDGYAATEYLQSFWQNQHPESRIPIIALTANAMSTDRQKCINSGMDDYLAKPVHMDDLADIIDKWLEQEAIRAELAAA